ncbi:MAG: tetratricopeptide repeat protein [Candidatus Omnitrophica bacterium]|nr:tetratricopeptide repeat protein [Candidatus Omnitrophota bacterium]MBD3268648.1 tetratricopeptide repeat protein [Candidatus Omnitrophota bacterium]
MKINISFFKKTALIIFGIFICLVLLEVSFRIGNMVFYFSQKRLNTLPESSSQSYRIMCLGESTTGFGGRYSYSSQLEDILNKRIPAMKFKVINKGIPGVHSSRILSELRKNINEYKPDMVTIMMGVNDIRGFVAAEGIPADIPRNPFKSLKIYNLFRLIFSHLKEKSKPSSSGDKGSSVLDVTGLNKKNEDFARELKEKINKYPQVYRLHKKYALYYFRNGEVEEARDVLEKYLEKNEAGIEELLDIGRIYKKFGSKREAKALFLKAFSLAPEDFLPYRELALLYREGKRFDRAEDVLESYLVDNPFDSRIYREKAMLYLDQMRLAEAEEVLEKLISFKSKDLESFRLLAKTYLLQGKTEKALEIHKWVLNNFEDEYSTNVDFANIFLFTGYLNEAERIFKKIMFQRDKDERPYHGLARIYTRQKKYAKAIEAFKKALGIKPDKALIWEDLAHCYLGQRLYSQAEKSFKKALRLDPDRFSVYESLGHMYNEQNKLKKAEAMFKKVLSIEPSQIASLEGLSCAYYNSGRLKQAEEMLKARIENSPQDAQSYILLAKYYLGAGLNDRAISISRKAVDLDPYNYRPYKLIGDCLIQKEDFAEARSYLKRALELCHNSELRKQVHIQLARCHNLLGDLKEAERILEKIISNDPYSEMAFIELGYCYMKQEKYKEAEECANKAITLNPFECRGHLLLESCYEIEGKDRQKDVLYDNLVYNYRHIAEIIQDEGLVLVCIQYPLCDIEKLRNILTGFEGIIFVDNEEIFKEALKKGDYTEYFTDSFAGEFGHCTPKGNRLLAENIADTLIREYFSGLKIISDK